MNKQHHSVDADLVALLGEHAGGGGGVAKRATRGILRLEIVQTE